MITDKNILSGKICPYCNKKTKHVPDNEIYQRSYGGMVYLCVECNAWVGCHKTRPKEALGRVANEELRKAKIAAHEYFDNLWARKIKNAFVSKKVARGLAYKWLSKKLDIPVEYCHIGMMDVDDCQRVVEVCRPYIKM